MKLKEKLYRFSHDPIGTVAARLKYAIRRLRQLRPPPNYQRLLKKAGVYGTVRAFASVLRSDAIQPDFADLWLLYSTVRWRKPEIILEFGSGFSTAVLAHALRDNGRGHLYSVESMREWQSSTIACIPQSLKRWCDISFSPVRVELVGGDRSFRHETLPDIAPNFVYLDGPPLTAEVPAASDLLFMEDRLPKDFYLVIDGRPLNYTFLKKHLKRRYRYEYREQQFKSIIEMAE